MGTKLFKWLAIVWLVIVGTLAAGALMHIPLWLSGTYDPIAHDGWSPDLLPLYIASIFGAPILFLATYRLALRYANS